MGKRGKRGDKPAAKKAILKRIDALAKKLEEELKGAELFGPPPPTDDCGICLELLPRVEDNKVFYQGCCGKPICAACDEKNKRVIEKTNQAHTCPFCREPEPNDNKELIRQLEVRASKSDGAAYNSLGNIFREGTVSVSKDEMKGIHYFILGAELGCAKACGNIAFLLHFGKSVPVDKVKAGLFCKVGAIRGDIISRDELGYLEYHELGNHELAIRHWKIAAAAGCQPSLTSLRDIYNANGKKPGKEFIDKDELDSIYRAGHEAQEEVKTEEREKHFEGEDEWRC